VIRVVAFLISKHRDYLLNNPVKIDKEEVKLINKAKADPDAFGQLYSNYVDRIYNYIYFRTGNIQIAEDLTSKVFYKALNNIGKYHHMGLPFSAWLYRIAHNVVANYYRDVSKIKEISIEGVDFPQLTNKSDVPEILFQKDQDVEALLNLISDLPKLRQELIIFKFVDKLSNAEIGVIMKKSEGAIKSLYHRTLLELRARINLGESTNWSDQDHK